MGRAPLGWQNVILGRETNWLVTARPPTLSTTA